MNAYKKNANQAPINYKVLYPLFIETRIFTLTPSFAGCHVQVLNVNFKYRVLK